MPIYRLATAVNVGTMLNRDVMMINPVVNDQGLTTDPDSLAQDWANAVASKLSSAGAPRVTVKVYDVQEHPHGPPKATKTANTLTYLPVRSIREVALCLSFYSGYNAKRRRGRLYIPLNWLSTTASVPGRPDTSQQDAVGAWAASLESLGGVDVDWSIYSKVDNVARKVTDWWVDDEWDIQRRRGDRPTARRTGTTSE